MSYPEQLEKEIKDIQIGKEEVKLCLLADNMILYVKNPKDFTHKKPVRTNKRTSNITGYKINIQKLVMGVPWWRSG